MSLEELIKENIAATKANTEALAALAAKLGNEAPKVKNKAEPKVEAAVEAPKAEPKAEPESTEPTVSYDDVKAVVLEASDPTKLGREKVLALLAQHGVKKAPELKPEQYAAVIADFKAAMSAAAEPALV